MKTCVKCGDHLPLELFAKDRRRKDGRGSYCKPCANSNVRASLQRHPETRRAWYEKNRETLREKQRQRLADPEARKRRNETQAAYNAANADKVREWKKAWRERNPTYHADWEANNREAARAHKRKSENKRRARKMNLPCEDIDPAEIFKRDEGVCGICGIPADPTDWHLDHIVPLALGGPHVSDNVQVSHPRCNLSKGSRLAA